MLVQAWPCNFVSGIYTSHFGFVKYEVFFSNTQLASVGNMVEGFGSAHYFPTYFKIYFLVFQLPNVFGQSGGIFGVPGLEITFVVPPPLFK